MEASFFDLSCYPIGIKYFDFNKVLYTNYPHSDSKLGVFKTAYELSGMGGFYSAIIKSLPERMIRDMKLNKVSRAVVLQLNTPQCDSQMSMERVTREYDQFISFGNIHPDDSNILSKIESNIKSGVKGWKIAPHVIGKDINAPETIELMKLLHDTNKPIVSCSGLALPLEDLNKLPKKARKVIESQDIAKFYELLKEIPDLKLVFAHGGLYQTSELIQLMKAYPKTYVDISTQPPENIKMLISELGSERLLYGTDYPAFNHAFSLVSVLRATNIVSERENILGLNAKRILGI